MWVSGWVVGGAGRGKQRSLQTAYLMWPYIGHHPTSVTCPQVTQWCSDVCACDLSVATAFSPLSWGFISGVTESASQLAGVAPAGSSASRGPAPPTSATIATLPAQLLPSMVQGAASGLMAGIGKGASLGSGLGANVLGGMVSDCSFIHWNSPVTKHSTVV